MLLRRSHTLGNALSNAFQPLLAFRSFVRLGKRPGTWEQSSVSAFYAMVVWEVWSADQYDDEDWSGDVVSDTCSLRARVARA